MRSKSKIIFAIPGRIRIKISKLLKTDGLVNEIIHSLEEEQGISSIFWNNRTKNILICYQLDQIDVNRILKIIDHFSKRVELNNKMPILSEQQSIKRCYKGSYKNESKLSARIFVIGLLIGGIASAFHFMLNRLIAIFVFSCPIVIFIAPVSAFYYAISKASNNSSIVVRNKAILDLLDKTETIYIKDSVLLLEEHNNMNKSYEAFHPQVQKFVFGMRENGITDIAILAERNRHDIHNVANQLGVKEIYSFKNTTKIHKFVQYHTMLVISENKTGFIDESLKGLVLYAYRDNYIENPLSDIKVKLNDLSKIPWLIGYSRYCREIIIRCQNIAIAINMCGILGASLGYIGPLGALIVYSISIIWQPIMIKSKVLSYEKEMNHGGKYSIS